LPAAEKIVVDSSQIDRRAIPAIDAFHPLLVPL
jgi:hypothetical protein